MTAKLVAEEGNLKGLVLSLEEGDAWVIGRDPEECQLVIEDPLASNKHLIARRTPEGISVENLSATNPALINDEEIGSESYLLQQGDAIRIGGELFRYYGDISAQVIEDEIPEEAEHEEEEGISDISELALSEESEEIETDQTMNQEPISEVPVPEENPPTEPELPTEELLPPEEEKHDTILEDSDFELTDLAEINFGVADIGRWLLKVVGGPNNGAEFYMQSGQSYILGTDSTHCDIVFHDNTVSRQHAKITITPEDTLLIEDLKSRNGVLTDGALLEGQQHLTPGTVATLGTTSFAVYDREGEMQTIISPLLPSIVKVLQQEEPPKIEDAGTPASLPAAEEVPVSELHAPPVEEPLILQKLPRNVGPWVFVSIVIGLFVLAGIGTTALFKVETVTMPVQENANELIEQALKPFPAIKFSYNKGTGSLLLLGHVTTQTEKSQLLYNLRGLNFIKNLDDSGIIIDELVWHEVNSILSENPSWKGITVHSPAAGQFVLSGYLRTRKQAEQLSAYISLNFPYLDLLKKQVVIEEDVINQINAWLQEDGLDNVTAAMANGEITLTGGAPSDKVEAVGTLVAKIKQIPGVRIVNNQIKSQAAEKVGIINLSDHYQVTGKSKIKDKYTVVVNGRILSEGDNLDGMDVTKITANTIFLERDDKKYRIDY